MGGEKEVKTDDNRNATETRTNKKHEREKKVNDRRRRGRRT